MEDLSLIQNVIDEYFKSESQSEAEVSSKFIAPLAKALGYPTELMALEFPVYGFGEKNFLRKMQTSFSLRTKSLVRSLMFCWKMKVVRSVFRMMF